MYHFYVTSMLMGQAAKIPSIHTSQLHLSAEHISVLYPAYIKKIALNPPIHTLSPVTAYCHPVSCHSKLSLCHLSEHTVTLSPFTTYCHPVTCHGKLSPCHLSHHAFTLPPVTACCYPVIVC